MRVRTTHGVRVVGAALALVLAGGAGAAVQGWGGWDDDRGHQERAHHRDRDHGRHGKDRERAKNVIFIVGDGMGIAHRELIRLATVGRDAELEMNQLQYQGWAQTDPADTEEVVTDSAAGATAFSTGVRSYNGAIAVDLDGNPVTTLLERAERAGKSTGLVTTSQVTDATPAAFGSHVEDRGNQSEIARQYLEETGVEVILGGGEDWWYPEGEEGAWPDNPESDPTEASKGTAGNLVERARELRYRYVTSAEELAAAPSRGKLLGLFANEEMFEHTGPAAPLYEPSVPLRDMAAKALEILSRDRDGFFLLIEEEGIDEMAHHGHAAELIQAGQALDETVGLAREFAAEHGDTLVVVVGDHETGGLAIELVDDEDESGEGEQEEGPFTLAGTDQTFTVDWTTGGHTGAATPASAEGPGARAMIDVRDNTDIHGLVLDAMRLGRR